jgi:hypothetical protein
METKQSTDLTEQFQALKISKGECGICLSEVEERALKCGHLFCSQCLTNFLRAEMIEKKKGFVEPFQICRFQTLSVFSIFDVRSFGAISHFHKP